MIVIHRNMKLTDALKASELLGAEIRFKHGTDDVFVHHRGVEGFHFRLCTAKKKNAVQRCLYSALRQTFRLCAQTPKEITLHS